MISYMADVLINHNHNIHKYTHKISKVMGIFPNTFLTNII